MLPFRFCEIFEIIKVKFIFSNCCLKKLINIHSNNIIRKNETLRDRLAPLARQ